MDKSVNSIINNPKEIIIFQDDYNDIMENNNKSTLNKYNDNVGNSDDNSDDLSEFLEYKDSDLEDDELDSILDFNFDFDIVYSPNSINDKSHRFMEIKSKIVNKIKLNAVDLIYIHKLDHDEKLEIIKIFNHMV
jgi:hypothetical protein